jgi:hypothetical protein
MVVASSLDSTYRISFIGSVTGFLSEVKEMEPARPGYFLSNHTSKKWLPAAKEVKMMAMKTGFDRR